MTITLFDQHFGDNLVVSDTHVIVDEAAPSRLFHPTVDWDSLADFYNLPRENEWREKIATVERDETGAVVSIGWITSYEVLAMRKGYLRVENPPNLAVCALVTTTDNKIVIGLRGGEISEERTKLYGSGLFGLPPTGALTWAPDNIITRALEQELSEELGLDFDCVESSQILGMFEVKEESFPGLKIAANLKVNLTLDQLVGKHQSAKDAWEHHYVKGVENNLEAIQAMLGPLRTLFIPPALGTLELYLRRCQS